MTGTALAATFSPFIGPLQLGASRALGDALRALLGAPDASVTPERTASIETEAFTRLVVSEGDARLGIVLRIESGGAWQLGPLSLTIEPEVDGRPATGHATSRAWLVRLAAFFGKSSATELAAHGNELARVHRRWATLNVIRDRDYRHVEKSHRGVAAVMRPSFRCNQNCHFCWEGRDWPEPDDGLIMTWLDELAGSGAKSITFCGGEPTLHKRLPELVERAHKTHGMTVRLHTNAVRFRDAGYTRALVDAGLSSLLVSLHSADPEVSDSMTRARGTWQRTVEGLHALLEARMSVAINCVVERANVEGLEAHARFVRAELVEAHRANPVCLVNYSQPGRYYDGDLFGARMVPFDESRPHVVAAARVLHEAGVLLEITGTCGFPSCIAVDIPLLVPWRANATHDATHASGRVRPPATCESCAAREHCVGVRREYLDRFGERGLVPFQRLHSSDWYERAKQAGFGEPAG
jgi:pyruvate-formate lyase-activating enzyme